MSRSAEDDGNAAIREGLEVLEAGVGELVRRLDELEEAIRDARERARRAEEALAEFTGADADPGDLVERLESLESENDELTERLSAGREAVDRLLAKVRFLEERE